jgi:hypothetical protein
VKAPTLRWFSLTWPREVEAEQVVQACRLLASAGRSPIVIESVGRRGFVEHRLALPREQASALCRQLRALMPGLATASLKERPAIEAKHGLELRITTRRRPVRTDDLATCSRAVLTALGGLSKDEQLSLQVVLARPIAPSVVSPEARRFRSESWLGALVSAPFLAPEKADAELRSALRLKHGEPGWRAVVRIGVAAEARGREHQLARQLIGALKGAEAPGVRFWFRPTGTADLVAAKAGWRRPLHLNAVEVAALSAWPVGRSSDLPIRTSGSRLLPPGRAIPRRGRVVAESTYPAGERPLALSPKASLRHLHVLGPTGSGKSTLLLGLIHQDMAAGRGVVVIEPKGDLIVDVLARVPTSRRADVVLIDPTDREKVVGLNPLGDRSRSPELAADQLLGMFHSMYAAHWGPRTHDILSAALLTLARLPGATLPALPLLLSDAGYRRRVLSKVVDPIGLGPFWSAYEAWSEPERIAATAPVMNKLRPLIMRPEMRAVLGQAKGSFALSRVFSERKILLVDLSKGQLGPETAALLGSLVVSQLWQAILGRSAVAPERRHPVFVYVDEFQDYLHLPVDFADALAQARGLGVGFALAHQYLHQLDPRARAAVLANAQSRVAFRLGGDDARILASESGLEAEDFRELGAYQCYAQLVAENVPQRWASAQTTLPPNPISDPAAVRAESVRRYGAPRVEIEASLQGLMGDSRRADADADDLTPRRRPGGHR